MTPFHIHTEYSLLKSSIKIPKLVEKAKKLGFKSLGIAEKGNLFSAIEFYEECKKNEIKPIIGVDIYVEDYEMLLVAKNFQGYQNLMEIISLAYLYNYDQVPKAKLEDIKRLKEGIAFILTKNSEPIFHLRVFDEEMVLKGAKGFDEALKAIEKFKDLDLYIELKRDDFEDELIFKDIINLAKKSGVKLIASGEVYYLNKEDFIYKDALECIGDNKQYDDFHREYKIGEYYLKSKNEYEKLFSDVKEAIENNKKLIETIDLNIPLGNPTPPKFKFTKEYAQKEGLDIEDDVEYFEYKCWQGLEKRLKKIPESEHQIYKDRLRREIEIIKKMKFPGYMLIVWDFINYAKDPSRHLRKSDSKIPVGPGRGSAAGSLVAYALEITNIDPIKYGLLFERFLNPERVSMPDIDVDFCQERRDEVIEYVQQKYGKENVAQVVTFGTLLAKGVLRDVARVFGIDYSQADKFVKLIPDKLGITLKDAKELEKKITEIINEDPVYSRLYSFAEALEGLKRNTGKHAAGVVISDDKLWKKTPLYRQDSNDEFHTTQYSLNYLEPVDLIKFDFLGLKTLTVIDKAIKFLNEKGVKVNIDDLELDDKEVFDLISSGETLGLFQIESKGMQELAKRLKPSNFEDIIAMLALYRPGPMDAGMLDDYIERKHGKKEVSYFFDEFEEVLKPILEPTYGVIVYQEQVMQIVQAIAGFSLGEADIIRRAMGKKKKDLMAKYAEEFATRAKERGFSYENAKALFELIEKFAGYGFNKSHSAAYAMITYQTAWLKRYHPTEFLAALLTYEANDTDKIAKYIDEAKRMKVEILPPDVNISDAGFTPKNKAIVFGLSAIKGVGEKAIESIIENRPFKDIKDFILKVDSKVNKKVLEQLIKAGALDNLGLDGKKLNRNTLLRNIDNILAYKKEIEEKKNALSNSLFGDINIDAELEIKEFEEMDMKELLEEEYKTLGFYVSANPLDPFKDELDKLEYNLSSEIKDLLNKEALFVGKVKEKKVRLSKKGNKFAIITLMDYHGEMDITLFEKDLEKLESMDLQKPIAIKAEVTPFSEFIRLTCKEVMSLEDAKNIKPAKKDEFIIISRELTSNYEEELVKLYNELSRKNGDKRVVLDLKTPFGFKLIVKTKLMI